MARIPDPFPSRMNRSRLLPLFLRVAGAVTALAFVAVVMPRSWMEGAHEALGMGPMPRGAVVDFMIRQASLVYGLHGAALWLMAGDVPRYRPLIRYTGWAFLLAAPIFAAIDYTADMPWFWLLGDGLCCSAVGATILSLVPRQD